MDAVAAAVLEVTHAVSPRLACDAVDAFLLDEQLMPLDAIDAWLFDGDDCGLLFDDVPHTV